MNTDSKAELQVGIKIFNHSNCFPLYSIPKLQKHPGVSHESDTNRFLINNSGLLILKQDSKLCKTLQRLNIMMSKPTINN